ncbi:hypothetical protein ES319_A01G006000v1 [Gossypium barbadense]|uniref:Cyclin-dependent kinase inhibitor domain-containing protein n=1 Tax=Gossypium barbadense TaxID=3634 RepID=A0A5J5WT68_GOSBA|nr:hypothetical protein ES319_A01G006000v1 [Gossypium barbadense]
MESSRTSFTLSKRRKTVDSKDLQELELPPHHFLEFRRRYVFELGSGDDSSSASRCVSYESRDIVKHSSRFVDLEIKSFETEISTCINNINKFSTKTTPTIELIGDSEEPPHRNTPPSPSPSPPPTQAEIDEFFSVAEKYEQVRFAKKYNYDIVKDVPLDGRYQWIRLKP